MSKRKPYPSRTADKFVLRFAEEGQRDRLAAMAERAMRSMNAQALYYIERGMREDEARAVADAAVLRAKASQ